MASTQSVGTTTGSAGSGVGSSLLRARPHRSPRAPRSARRRGCLSPGRVSGASSLPVRSRPGVEHPAGRRCILRIDAVEGVVVDVDLELFKGDAVIVLFG